MHIIYDHSKIFCDLPLDLCHYTAPRVYCLVEEKTTNKTVYTAILQKYKQ